MVAHEPAGDWLNVIDHKLLFYFGSLSDLQEVASLGEFKLNSYDVTGSLCVSDTERIRDREVLYALSRA